MCCGNENTALAHTVMTVRKLKLTSVCGVDVARFQLAGRIEKMLAQLLARSGWDTSPQVFLGTSTYDRRAVGTQLTNETCHAGKMAASRLS